MWGRRPSPPKKILKTASRARSILIVYQIAPEGPKKRASLGPSLLTFWASICKKNLLHISLRSTLVRASLVTSFEDKGKWRKWLANIELKLGCLYLLLIRSIEQGWGKSEKIINRQWSDTGDQKYSRLICLLRVKGLVINLGWSGSTLLITKHIIKTGSKSCYLLAAVINFEPTYIICFLIRRES